MPQALYIYITNYLVLLWLLVLWLSNEGKKKFYSLENNLKIYKKSYSVFFVLLIIIPIIIWVGTRGNVEDTLNYRNTFLALDVSLDSFNNIMMSDVKGKGFIILQMIIKFFIGNKDVLFFIIIAAISLLFLSSTFRLYSCAFPFSILLFVISADCYQWMFNGIRQFIAVAIVFYAYKYLLSKRKFVFFIFVLIASTIHTSALISLIALYFIDEKPFSIKSVFLVFVIMIVVLYIENFTSILSNLLTDTEYSNVVQQFARDDGVSFIRVLVYSVPLILSFISKKLIFKRNDKLIYFAINMSLISTCLYFLGVFTSGIYIGRLPIYFSLWNYILLPWLIKNLFNVKNRNLIYFLTIVCYLIYNYMQMSVFMYYYW